MEVKYGKLNNEIAIKVFSQIMDKYKKSESNDRIPSIMFDLMVIPAIMTACSLGLGYAFAKLGLFDGFSDNFWSAYLIILIAYLIISRKWLSPYLRPCLFKSVAYMKAADRIIEYAKLYAFQEQIKKGYDAIHIKSAKHYVRIMVVDPNFSEDSDGYACEVPKEITPADFGQGECLDFSWVDSGLAKIAMDNQLDMSEINKVLLADENQKAGEQIEPDRTRRTP